MPRHSAPTLHPSTQLIGKCRVTDCIDSSSSKVRVNGRRPITSSRQSSALAAVRTRADLAVLFTGTPCGPFEASLVASNPMGANGVTL